MTRKQAQEYLLKLAIGSPKKELDLYKKSIQRNSNKFLEKEFKFLNRNIKIEN